ncbi:hypothetical protein Nepgr_006268 [Nepenthes gracilis]|uniref:Uncharacterized protein n=1 Tax=Nepenthes gracilis TaxID=150966 RepID=A0AAD3S4P4_NEPGR|nr:hypothetical protein Nepgr_006268 [Nepenthes gracilis]
MATKLTASAIVKLCSSASLDSDKTRSRKFGVSSSFCPHWSQLELNLAENHAPESSASRRPFARTGVIEFGGHSPPAINGASNRTQFAVIQQPRPDLPPPPPGPPLSAAPRSLAVSTRARSVSRAQICRRIYPRLSAATRFAAACVGPDLSTVSTRTFDVRRDLVSRLDSPSATSRTKPTPRRPWLSNPGFSAILYSLGNWFMASSHARMRIIKESELNRFSSLQKHQHDSQKYFARI